MEQRKSPSEWIAEYWDKIKDWLEAHQQWVAWPFEQIAKLFQLVWDIIQSGSTTERLVLAVVILIVVLIAYIAFIIGLREVLIRLPGFNRVPFGLPGNDDYQVKPTGYDRPMEYEWRYPKLWVGGTQFDFSKAMLDKEDALLFYLKTGTEVRFLPKAHKNRGI